ncbi:MAG: BatA domain-containing protein [Prosthecobacter sp.]|uniref:BatA domain-containing protein n=1 Tax=Prosthecobacter sp. TaxID=1965333 RepID=UPI003902B771
MTWLFPLYLAGAAAIIAPILLHLRRRPPQDRVEFSSLLFLDAQTPVPVSKRRLENWLLLLLRCLALILLALMFARPLLRSESAAATSPDRATLILIDRSASMRRDDLWQRALDEAKRTAQSAKLTDRVALAVFDQKLTPLWTFEEDRASPASRTTEFPTRLAAHSPSWSATHLDRALIDAVALFDTNTASLKKHILLITDLQEGTHLDALRTIAWPADLRLQVHRLDPTNPDNLSLALAASESTTDTPARPDATANTQASTIRVRLANNRDSRLRDFTLAWKDAPKSDSITAQLQPGASRILTAPPNSTNAITLTLTGDTQDFDNHLYIAPPQPRTVRIHFLGDATTRDEAAAPLYYLSRALQPTTTLAPALSADQKLPAQNPDIIFLSGATTNAETNTALRDFLTQGGFLVHVIASPTDATLIKALTGLNDLTITDGDTTDDYRMLGEVNTAHPLLKPFADPRLRDFTKFRFWHHRVITLPNHKSPIINHKSLETLASFDNGHPAILTARIGKGTLILLASGWHPGDSQFALSTKFVPLLYGWLAAAGFSHDPAASLIVGDTLPLDATQSHTITDPDNKTHTLKPGQTFTTELIGLHTIESPSPSSAKATAGKRQQTVAVNLPPDEGRVLPLEPQKLADYGIKLASAVDLDATTASADQQRLSATETEQRQRSWWWILLGLLAVLLLETWFAGRSRHSIPATA